MTLAWDDDDDMAARQWADDRAEAEWRLAGAALAWPEALDAFEPVVGAVRFTLTAPREIYAAARRAFAVGSPSCDMLLVVEEELGPDWSDDIIRAVMAARRPVLEHLRNLL